jgi:hypothetical protein
MPDPEKQDSPRAGDNRSIIEAIRNAFTPITNRLTPDVDPVTIYRPYEPSYDSSSRVEKPE